MVTVTAVVLGSQQLVTERTETGWQTRGVALATAYTTDPAAPGELVPITGNDATVLGMLGFEPDFAAARDWQPGAAGSAPTIVEVGQWWVTELANWLGRVSAEFVGKRVAMFLTQAE